LQINEEKNKYFQTTMATHLTELLRSPLMGRDSQFGQHCDKTFHHTLIITEQQVNMQHITYNKVWQGSSQ